MVVVNMSKVLPGSKVTMFNKEERKEVEGTVYSFVYNYISVNVLGERNPGLFTYTKVGNSGLINIGKSVTDNGNLELRFPDEDLFTHPYPSDDMVDPKDYQKLDDNPFSYRQGDKLYITFLGNDGKFTTEATTILGIAFNDYNMEIKTESPSNELADETIFDVPKNAKFPLYSKTGNDVTLGNDPDYHFIAQAEYDYEFKAKGIKIKSKIDQIIEDKDWDLENLTKLKQLLDNPEELHRLDLL